MPRPCALRPSPKVSVLLLEEQPGSHVEAFQRWWVVGTHRHSPSLGHQALLSPANEALCLT